MLPLIGAVIIGPYIGAKNRYASVFESQPKLVGLPWFSIFQAGSAFTNLGMSLVDTSVVPFQRAYLMNAVVALLILAGNTCFVRAESSVADPSRLSSASLCSWWPV